MVFFVMVVAAAEVVVGLDIIMTVFKTRRSAAVDDANLLKYRAPARSWRPLTVLCSCAGYIESFGQAPPPRPRCQRSRG